MDEAVWPTVDHDLADRFRGGDPVLGGVLAAEEAAGLPSLSFWDAGMLEGIGFKHGRWLATI